MKWELKKLYVYISKFIGMGGQISPFITYSENKMEEVVGDWLYVPICELEVELPTATAEEMEEFLQDSEIKILEQLKDNAISEATRLDCKIKEIRNED